MAPLELIPFLALLAAVAAWIAAPVRNGVRSGGGGNRSALEAERDARLAAVRDAELDLATGKLSYDDHRVLDERLRAEAVEALRALERAHDDKESA